MLAVGVLHFSLSFLDARREKSAKGGADLHTGGFLQ